MNTLLITSQIVFYGAGFVSASLNIAKFVRRRRGKTRTFRVAGCYYIIKLALIGVTQFKVV